jgi:hypothetical protein
MNDGGMFPNLFRRIAVKKATTKFENVTSDITQTTFSTVTPKSSSSKNAAAAVTNSGKKSIFRTTAPGAWVRTSRMRLLLSYVSLIH